MTGTPAAEKRAVMSGVSAVNATSGLPVASIADTSASANSGKSRPTLTATAPAISGWSSTCLTAGAILSRSTWGVRSIGFPTAANGGRRPRSTA